MRRLLVMLSFLLIGGALFAACTPPNLPAGADLPAPQEAQPPLAENNDVEPLSGSVPLRQRTVIIDESRPPSHVTGFSEWSTDFTRRTIEWDEILSGGPPKDGIPSIDEPTFEPIEDAQEWLTDRDPVIVLDHNGVRRAYPLSILIWHEIVNDEIGGLPVAVTFCPLCNASVVFDRRFGDRALDFGTTGNLRKSDLVMYDRQTESWWQQFTGEGLVGELAGEKLTFLPSQLLSFADFRAKFPSGEVLARPDRNGRFLRDYGRNPYVGYDSNERPFLFRGTVDERMSAVERVVGVTTETAARAYSFSDVAEAQVINDTFDGTPLVIFHKAGLASALDAGRISEGRDIGSVSVYDRRVNGEALTFAPGDEGTFVDEETGSVWNILGQAVAGELTGAQLTPILNFDHFWFAWAAFFPDTEVWGK